MLADKHCVPLNKESASLDGQAVRSLLGELHSEWSLLESQRLYRQFEFANFHETMAFVNAVAWIAHREDHHPNMEVGYKRCTVRYTSHAVGGLSENDFICAAQIDRLFA